MVTMNVTDARARLADAVDAAEHRGERTILSRRGKAAAAVVSMDDVRLLEQLEDEYDLELARKALAEGGPAISHEQLKAELGIE